MRKTIGVLAHVDAGKTTLSERILFEAQAIRKLGRVDHRDSFMDVNPIERSRGITIFSGQAVIQTESQNTIYWMDTPGHVDFSPEMERALSVLDYAVLIISSVDGIQSHSETLWHLLRDAHVPTLIFLSKTDSERSAPDDVIAALQKELSPDIMDFRCLQTDNTFTDAVMEELAAQDEELLDCFLAGNTDRDLFLSRAVDLISRERIFPVLAGSALTGNGMERFLTLLDRLTVTDYQKTMDAPVSARVYQIRHDPHGQRLCFLKLLSGTLRVKEEINGEKLNELRIYHGDKYRQTEIAYAGDLIAVPGMESLKAGDCIGDIPHRSFRIEPMMQADVLWDDPAIADVHMYRWLRILEDEEPTLCVENRGVHLSVHIMGMIQLEILQQLMMDRFGVAVHFGPCSVLYRETIAAPVIGIGHYEPLRHYAEVQLRLVPTEAGSGISFRSLAHVDDLALNWQRLIETHIFEKTHKGVLTGSPLTDVRIELLKGKAHLKHTEGGDFRQSVYRAIRNGLMYADNILLEPICGFQLRFPSEQFGTISGALIRCGANCDSPVFADAHVSLKGEAPFQLFSRWQTEYMMVTHGKGTQRVWLSHYAPCSEQNTIVNETGYNPLAEDTPDSVFCSHGAGYTVPWNEVRAHAHLVVEE